MVVGLRRSVVCNSFAPPHAENALHALAPGVELVTRAGLDRIRAKGIALTELAIRRGEGLLAVRYGDRATAYLENNLRNVSLAVIALLILALAGSALWSRARRGEGL